MDREEDREEIAEEVRGEPVEGGGEVVVGGVGIFSLGLVKFEFDVIGEDDDELCEERSGLRVGEEEGDGFGVSCGSIAEKQEGNKKNDYWKM